MMRAGLALFVLLLPVAGWADDPVPRFFRICDSSLQKCRLYDSEWETCYQRMREAMREATLFINQKAGRVIYEKNGKMWVVPDPALVDEWNAVMRDCVKEE